MKILIKMIAGVQDWKIRQATGPWLLQRFLSY